MTRLPGEELHIEAERLTGHGDDFLRVWNRRIQHSRPDGSLSEVYSCDSVVRSLGLDAVAMVLHYEDDDGRLVLGLRASRRPAVVLDRARMPDRPSDARLWEVPAGILEPGDEGRAGRCRRCSLEAVEEMGARVAPEAFEPLGPPVFTSPGVIAERVYLYHAEVAEPVFVLPEGDGSPMEEDSLVAWLTVEEALQRCRQGLSDAKTEIALMRFVAELGV